MASKAIPQKPTEETSLPDTKAYLEYLMARRQAVTVRELISFWGSKSRGRHVLRIIEGNLAEMNLAVTPPLDSGALDDEVLIERADARDYLVALSGEPASHMLTVSRIPAASFALPRPTQAGAPDGLATSNLSVDEAITRMLKNDYSQLVVVAPDAERVPLGVFSWESYGRAWVRGERPSVVGDAVMSAHFVDLHSDLFEHLERIETSGFVIVTFRGQLAGIVTASDLAQELRTLALPFLEIGRCERELRRVAKLKFPSRGPEYFDKGTLGDLIAEYENKWADLGWALSKETFVKWAKAVKELRNSIAHFDDEPGSLPEQLESVARLTRWLTLVDGRDAEAAEDGLEVQRKA